jgi:hypothetical protein
MKKIILNIFFWFSKRLFLILVKSDFHPTNEKALEKDFLPWNRR